MPHVVLVCYGGLKHVWSWLAHWVCSKPGGCYCNWQLTPAVSTRDRRECRPYNHLHAAVQKNKQKKPPENSHILKGLRKDKGWVHTALFHADIFRAGKQSRNRTEKSRLSVRFWRGLAPFKWGLSRSLSGAEFMWKPSKFHVKEVTWHFFSAPRISNCDIVQYVNITTYFPFNRILMRNFHSQFHVKIHCVIPP